MSRISRQLVRLSFVVGLLAVLFFVLKAGVGSDPPTHVSVIRPVRQTFTSYITTNGKVEPIEPRTVQARLTTFIERILIKEGDPVRQGQPLMTLDGTEFQSQLANAKEQLVSAESDRAIGLAGGAPQELAQLENDLAKTEVEIQRLRRQNESLTRLYAREAATRDEVEQNKAALEKAETDKRLIERRKNAIAQSSKLQAERAFLRAEEARTSIQSLQEKMNSARLTAPVSGTVYSLPARQGTLVHIGDPVAEIADLTHVRVRAFVDEPDLGSLNHGQAIEVSWDALPNRKWVGEVVQLPKTIVARGSRNVGEVLCSVDNEKTELLPETNVNVRIRTAEHSNSVTIPRSAVLTEGNKRFVWGIDSNRLRKQAVTVGLSNMQDYEIVSGLTENDLVALPGNVELHEGQVVTFTDLP
jgi:HlyD family secretion protein